MALLKVTDVSKSFKDKNALQPTSLEVNMGECIAIVGETGSGKTTLIKIIGGLEDSDSGKVLFKKEEIVGPSEKLIPGHEKILYLSQHFTLPKFISVREHLENAYQLSEDEADKINSACQIVHLLDKKTNELSGGEKQRVALAKVLTNTPKVLLLDEPFSNLDMIHKQTIKEVLDQVHQNWKTTLIMVSHEPRDVLPWADKVIIMIKGKVIQSDTPKTIYGNPANEYVAGLCGSYNLIHPDDWRIKNQSKYTLIGDQLLIRPEQINISKNGGEVAGEIQRIDFLGGIKEVMVKTAFQKVIVQVTNEKFEIGEEVSLSIN